MNELLQEAIKESKGALSRAVIKQVESVSGGSIHKAWLLKLNNGQHLFAKTAQAEDFPKLEFEASGLNSLNRFADKELIEIPQPLVLKKLSHISILILPWLDFGVGDQTMLGKGLALLHQSSTTNNPGKFHGTYIYNDHP